MQFVLLGWLFALYGSAIYTSSILESQRRIEEAAEKDRRKLHK